MARRRYQEGSIRSRGDSWEIRWKEDVVKKGVVHRVHRSRSIAKTEFPTKSLAKRERDRILEDAGVKSEDYTPSRVGTFDDFVTKWKTDVVATMSITTQTGFKSELKAWSAAFTVEKNGARVSMPMREIDGSSIQTVVSRWHTGAKVGAKTIKNRVGTLRNAWKWALEWRFTRIPFPANLRLPVWDRDEAKAKRPAYTMEIVKRIMTESQYPYNLVWWLAFELHLRRGELCGLDVGHINLSERRVTIRRNRVMSTVKSTKANKPRVFGISEELCEALRPSIEGRATSDPLFLSPDGVRLHPENLAKRNLNPVLQKLGIKVKGTALHGLRHGAATELDRRAVPMATRMNRLGHADEPTTYLYTHAVTEDDKQVSAMFGKELSQAFTQTFTRSSNESENAQEEMILGTA